MRTPTGTAHQAATAFTDPQPNAASPVLVSAVEHGQLEVCEGSSRDPGAGAPSLPGAMLTTAFMQLSCGVIVVDTGGRVVCINEAGKELRAVMLRGHGSVCGDMLPDDSDGSPLNTSGTRLAAVLAGDAVPDVDYVLEALGEARHRVIQVAIAPLRDVTAQITGAVLTLTDLTDRLDVQATLVHASDALAQMTRETLAREAGVLALKALAQAQHNRDLTRTNTELEHQATLARVADALAEGMRETLAREAGALARKALEQAQDNRDLTRSNSKLEHQATLARAADALAQVARETLAREARTLAETALTQAQHNHDLTRSNNVLEQFASVASHDLQEPLRKIQAFGDRLKTVDGHALSPAGADFLQRMQHAAARMQVLINDLLVFARVSAGPPSLSPVDLAAVTRAVLTDLEMQVAQSGGRVEVGPLPTIAGDPLRLRQLLQNLISNALKFRRPEVAPVVIVSGVLLPREDAEEGSPAAGACSLAWLQLTVQDNGIGFEQKYAERIFEVFKRLHGRSAYEGTGVGLALCRRIAEQHGGHITATSAPEQGATIRVTLPLYQAQGVSTP